MQAGVRVEPEVSRPSSVSSAKGRPGAAVVGCVEPVPVVEGQRFSCHGTAQVGIGCAGDDRVDSASPDQVVHLVASEYRVGEHREMTTGQQGQEQRYVFRAVGRRHEDA